MVVEKMKMQNMTKTRKSWGIFLQLNNQSEEFPKFNKMKRKKKLEVLWPSWTVKFDPIII
jgi:hypothetical protein